MINFLLTFRMAIQIYSAIWPFILKCCAIKILWIFLFVVVCITTFLMVMYKSHKQDLKQSILPNDTVENVHGKISDLKENLRSKEIQLKESKRKSKLLKKTTLANTKKSSLRNLQKKLINDLKTDVLKTESELTELENEILLLSKRKENVKNEISKQQEEYNKCMQIFLND